MSFLDWHIATARRLLDDRSRIPHALLIEGPAGSGVPEFASALAQALLCEQPVEGMACGKCAGCHLYGLGNHPDFRLVQPDALAAADDAEAEPAPKGEKKSEQIRIDQVRALQEFLAVGTHRQGSRVIVLHPADTMNEPTQNALLKSLEEPPPATLFMLVTSDPQRLLPTIRSRCQAVTLPKPGAEAALRWLAAQGVKEPETALSLAGGAPLLAAEMAERADFLQLFASRLSDRRLDALALATACANVPVAEFVAALYRWCYDVLSVRLAGKVRYHVAHADALRDVAARCRPERMAGFLRKLAESRELAGHPLNARLVFEDLLLQYHALVQGR
jgi:DNA polymerase-3 subunit delta'